MSRVAGPICRVSRRRARHGFFPACDSTHTRSRDGVRRTLSENAQYSGQHPSDYPTAREDCEDRNVSALPKQATRFTVVHRRQHRTHDSLQWRVGRPAFVRHRSFRPGGRMSVSSAQCAQFRVGCARYKAGLGQLNRLLRSRCSWCDPTWRFVGPLFFLPSQCAGSFQPGVLSP